MVYDDGTVSVGCVTVAGQDLTSLTQTVTSGSTVPFENGSVSSMWVYPTYLDSTFWYPPRRRASDYTWPSWVTQIVAEKETVKISLKEANKLRKAAKDDPKLGEILKKFADHIEIETDEIFD